MIGLCALCGEKIKVLGLPHPNDPDGFVGLRVAQLMHMSQSHESEMRPISMFAMNVSLLLAGLNLVVSEEPFEQNQEASRSYLARGIRDARLNDVTRKVVFDQPIASTENGQAAPES